MFDIGVDLDGVVHNFVDSLRHYVVSTGIRTAEQCAVAEKMDFFKYWYNDKGEGIENEEFLDICHKGVDDGVVFYHGAPFPDARKALEDLRYYGHKVHIITDRTFGSENRSHSLTREWLKKYDIPYDSLTFSADKTVVPTDIMIDDKIENVIDLENAGTYAFLYDRPWNRVRNNDRFNRVGSLQEFVHAVEWLAFEEDQQFEYNAYGEVNWV